MFNSKSQLLACAAAGVFAAIGMGGGMAKANTITDNFNSDAVGAFNSSGDTLFTNSAGTVKIVNIATGNNVAQFSAAANLDTKTAAGNAPWKPTLAAPLTITGDWTFLSAPDYNDELHIYTRESASGDGIRFGIGIHHGSNTGPAYVFADQYGATGTGSTSVGTPVYTGSFTTSVALGDVLAFTVTDNGSNITLNVTDTNNNATASLTETSTYTPTNNDYLVSFLSNEAYTGGGTGQGNLDNVTITNSAVPEPATLGLMAVAGTAILLVGKRKRA
ncbi:MAG: PEP-CTERM sorting domain-containing protein [Phycisphaerae bacterium]|nr:PEP-CTERM sorting domain-containing protein [Phycisphaerae bacterium]